jgi:ABC-type multidrug transport system permease subunit
VLGVTAPAVVFYALVNVAIAFGYLFLQRAVFKAHGARATFSPWNFVGLLAYPIATVAGIFVPILAIIIIALVSVFYAMPRSVEFSRRPLEEGI